MFDRTKMYSFENLQEYWEVIEIFRDEFDPSEKVPIYIIGNKSDLSASEVIFNK